MLEAVGLGWLFWTGVLVWAGWQQKGRILFLSSVIPPIFVILLLTLLSIAAGIENGNGSGLGLTILIGFGGPALVLPAIIGFTVFLGRRFLTNKSA